MIGFIRNKNACQNNLWGLALLHFPYLYQVLQSNWGKGELSIQNPGIDWKGWCFIMRGSWLQKWSRHLGFQPKWHHRATPTGIQQLCIIHLISKASITSKSKKGRGKGNMGCVSLWFWFDIFFSAACLIKLACKRYQEMTYEMLVRHTLHLMNRQDDSSFNIALRWVLRDFQPMQRWDAFGIGLTHVEQALQRPQPTSLKWVCIHVMWYGLFMQMFNTVRFIHLGAWWYVQVVQWHYTISLPM